jgi:hypothetical protein
LAGTQGVLNHRKKDRLFELAESKRLPVVFFTEGGGGRPGDTDNIGVSLLDCWAFYYLGGLSGWSHSSASTPDTASPGTRRCWGAATS